MNANKSTMNPSQIDDLGFFPTIKMGVVTPIKTSLKVGVSGLIIADAMANSLYENKERLASHAKHGVETAINLLDDALIGVHKLHIETRLQMGVRPDASLEDVFKEMNEAAVKDWEEEKNNSSSSSSIIIVK